MHRLNSCFVQRYSKSLLLLGCVKWIYCICGNRAASESRNWFNKWEQSNRTEETQQGWRFPGKLGKVAGKFCVKDKGYTKKRGGGSIGMLLSRWGTFIQCEVFPGKRIKYNKTSHFNSQDIGCLLERDFKASKTANSSEYQLLSALRLCPSCHIQTGFLYFVPIL